MENPDLYGTFCKVDGIDFLLMRRFMKYTSKLTSLDVVIVKEVIVIGGRAP